MGPDSSGLASLFLKKRRAFCFLSRSLSTLSAQWEGGCLHPKGKALTRHQPFRHLYLGLTVSKTVRKQTAGV